MQVETAWLPLFKIQQQEQGFVVNYATTPHEIAKHSLSYCVRCLSKMKEAVARMEAVEELVDLESIYLLVIGISMLELPREESFPLFDRLEVLAFKCESRLSSK